MVGTTPELNGVYDRAGDAWERPSWDRRDGAGVLGVAVCCGHCCCGCGDCACACCCMAAMCCMCMCCICICICCWTKGGEGEPIGGGEGEPIAAVHTHQGSVSLGAALES